MPAHIVFYKKMNNAQAIKRVGRVTANWNRDRPYTNSGYPITNAAPESTVSKISRENRKYHESIESTGRVTEVSREYQKYRARTSRQQKERVLTPIQT